MSELTRLRGELTDEQRGILTAIWDYFREHKQWMPIRLLHQTHGGKPTVWACLEQLGGAIVYEYEENAARYYRLTFPGILLTGEGARCEKLLVAYLGYVAQKCAEDPLRTKMSSRETVVDLKLDTVQVSLLGYLISEGHFLLQGSIGLGSDEWGVEISEDVEDLPQDLLGYVHERAMRNYESGVPINAAKRSSYHWGKLGTASSEKITQAASTSGAAQGSYIDESRIAELRALNPQTFDLKRLIKLCEELNICYLNGCYLATAILTRALLDHVPPIFGFGTFSEVANNHKGSRSFRDQMQHLDRSCRKIADANLHVQIRKKEVLLNRTQVNFANDLDVLLAEIVRMF